MRHELIRLGSMAQKLGRTPTPDEIHRWFPDISRSTAYRWRDALLTAWGIEPTGDYLRTAPAPDWREGLPVPKATIRRSRRRLVVSPEMDRMTDEVFVEKCGELLSDMGIGGDEAREITSNLSEWHGKLASGYEMPEDVMQDTGDRAEAELRGEWGKDYNARVTLARRTAAEAMKRAPWLRDLIERTPAGNDPNLIRHFAELGLRQARRKQGAA